MHTAAEVWTGIKELSIDIYADIFEFYNDNDDPVSVPRHRDDLNQTSAAVAATMPGVLRVNFGGDGDSPPVPHFQWPSNHSWLPFSTGEGTMTIEFPSLRALSVLSLTVLPEHITCTSLTWLEILPLTSADTMLGLLQRLPNLAVLKLWNLTLDDIQAAVSVPKPGEGCPVEPFDARLRILHICARRNEKRLKAPAPVVKYLLLKTPTLAEARLAGVSIKRIAKFVVMYSGQYPHLASIDFGSKL
ncbi:hypothetical protein H4R18_004192 [Coemansia javaensis]|uniref:Uncharacterized protein n=1 Tax=Coemansia javaensis TaxID=2761396 RepID=A0A9W8H5L2_9FUNG|nr:hypothetical protein H4R18_004192 [Coemansia javaensis]